MNVDIINALNNSFRICNIISESSMFDNIGVSIEDVLKYDLINFIKIISIENSERRMRDFSLLYFNQPDVKEISIHSPIKSISTPLFVLFDKKTNNTSCKILIDLFIEIGRYYLFNNSDKKDIDSDKFANYILEIKDYVLYDLEVYNDGLSNHNIKVKEEIKVEDNKNEVMQVDRNEKGLNELLDEFNSLIGLDGVKSEIRKRINQIQVDQRRIKAGHKVSSMSLHMVFTGNPGTGKTTVARKLATIYKQLGVLSQGQLVEVDRSGLVGSYVGSTAIKTQEVIDKAVGGILFIDEAYTLAKDGNDFGQEAIDTLLKAMEDKRNDLVVIVAGYTKEMERFIKSNPGLESRFNKYIEFEDYNSKELLEIFNFICEKDGKYIHEECNDFLRTYFENMSINKTSNFANGRAVRNYYEKVLDNLNERLAEDLDNYSDEELQIIKLVDLY